MEEKRGYNAHVVVLPFPAQGHINPLLQFSKRLDSKGIKITVSTTLSSVKSMQSRAGSITLESIYDDNTEGALARPAALMGFLEKFEVVGAHCLGELFKKLENSEYPVKGLVYDANLPWALNIAQQLGVASVAFFTQSCAAIACYYPMYVEMCGKPLSVPAFSMPGLRQPALPNPASFGSETERFPPLIKHILNQFSNIEKADWILFNSFYKLEEEVLKWITNLYPTVRTIGPTLPSVYLDKRLEDDKCYGFNLYKPISETYMQWLNSKEPASVVYVSFGSTAALNAPQMIEMAHALRQTSSNFLWVVKETEESSLPNKFVEDTSGKGLVVAWCSQLEVLAHQAIGCFITHCGWNSTMEGVSLGVPMVGMPQFLDQMANAYLLEKVWEVGVQPKVDEKGLASGEEIESCINQVMQVGGRRKEFKKKAMQWKQFAMEAMNEGGSSDKCIDEIIGRLVCS
ncbi:hypothetical protein I3760_08G080100 [Carya illinoinensis]|uniref:Glycosyltransferase n=1 Tax=Carya illinoinensis TaxID=32201 RepID=A0A8T1PV91_CARIL|nr:hypothetical protein I3760_08G080100 [Carya illinoinensis]KAG6644802.1 hypothetical protein CIPAW_08G078000 [Carya illinoinensis]